MDEEENLEEQVEPVNVEVEEPGAEVQEEVKEAAPTESKEKDESEKK